MTLIPYLRARVVGLQLTAISQAEDLLCEASLELCPRIAWAARLAEFEFVELHPCKGGAVEVAMVLFGEEGKARLWSKSTPLQRAATVQLRAHGWRIAGSSDDVETTLVQLGRGNALTEIRTVVARTVPIDPSYVPLLARRDIRSPLLAST